MEGRFFSSATTLIRTRVVAALADISLVLLLRLSERRTLSKMNAFDLVVTVALGSTFATILLNRDVSRAEGALESDGSFSGITNDAGDSRSTLSTNRGQVCFLAQAPRFF